MNIRLAIFASGSGTNAENIIRYFQDSGNIHVSVVLTNNPQAGVIKRAEGLGVSCTVLSASDFKNGSKVMEILHREKIDFLVLAGFLLLVPGVLIKEYAGRIINIHPALLPSYGGKGFYGDNVHRSVIQSGDPISGITIHHVNEQFDKGAIIFQAACHVSKKDDSLSLAKKIHQLEHVYFPRVIQKVILREFAQKD